MNTKTKLLQSHLDLIWWSMYLKKRHFTDGTWKALYDTRCGEIIDRNKDHDWTSSKTIFYGNNQNYFLTKDFQTLYSIICCKFYTTLNYIAYPADYFSTLTFMFCWNPGPPLQRIKSSMSMHLFFEHELGRPTFWTQYS